MRMSGLVRAFHRFGLAHINILSLHGFCTVLG